MQFNKTIKIGGATVADNARSFIIAEAGVNHKGDMGLAGELIDCAVRAGADAVKFQSFKTEHLVLKKTKKAPYQSKTTDPAESQFEMLKKLELTREEALGLKNYCEKRNIIFLTTPFDDYSLEELNGFDLPAYKVSSTDITNLPFLKKIAKKQKPIILSTGTAYLSEVELALREIHPYNRDVILLQCTANYPIKDEETNLNVIDLYKKKFNILIGYSDHSVGVGAAPFAVAMGAKVIEKHFTLDKNFEGPDHQASLEPKELERFVGEIRRAEKYLGSGIKEPTASESETRKSLQKCLVATRKIKKGELLTEGNITAKRTGGVGTSPLHYRNIIGRKADKDYASDEIISA